MSCSECNNLTDITDLSRPYVVRTCSKCGRKINLRNPGAHGIGLKVDKGEEFVIPAGFIQLSANPLKSSGHFTAYGLSQFVEMLFGIDISNQNNREIFAAAIPAIMKSNENFFKNAEC